MATLEPTSRVNLASALFPSRGRLCYVALRYMKLGLERGGRYGVGAGAAEAAAADFHVVISRECLGESRREFALS